MHPWQHKDNLPNSEITSYCKITWQHFKRLSQSTSVSLIFFPTSQAKATDLPLACTGLACLSQLYVNRASQLRFRPAPVGVHTAGTAQSNQCKCLPSVTASAVQNSKSRSELSLICRAMYISGPRVRLNSHHRGMLTGWSAWLLQKSVMLLSHFYSWWEPQENHILESKQVFLMLCTYLQAKGTCADTELCAYLPATTVLSEYSLSRYRQAKSAQLWGKILCDTH